MKRKIVFYIAGLQRGGAERVITNLAGYFQGIGYEVTFFTDCVLKKEYTLADGIAREIVGYEPTGKRIRDMFRRITVIREAYKRIKPDVVVSFIGKTNIRAILAAMGTGIPVVVSVRNDPDREYYSKAMRILAKLLFGQAAGVVFQTEDARAWFGKKVQKKSAILANPLQEKVIRPRFEGERADEIVAVSRLEKAKNHKMLLQAFAKIEKQFPDTVLKIYGNGSQRETLEKLSAELGLIDRVQFMGDREDATDLIYRSRLFVLSSDYEGMPNALLEAMAMGLTVIATDCPCGGPKTVIENEENGLLVPVGDVDSLAAAMKKVLSDDKLSEKLGRNAHKLSEQMAPERVHKAWQEYIEGVS
ncbi:MAG: glycosyltransferase family 4 protein [Clostridiales bacterium]|nr:glycosyltransferase family 4 protein [Clostridiales bacterium]